MTFYIFDQLSINSFINVVQVFFFPTIQQHIVDLFFGITSKLLVLKYKNRHVRNA